MYEDERHESFAWLGEETGVVCERCGRVLPEPEVCVACGDEDEVEDGPVAA